MSPLDAALHLVNFFAPAWLVAALLGAAVKLAWRKEMKNIAWRRLMLWGAGGGSLATLAALLLLGHDGEMAGYALLLLGISLPQWWLMQRR